MTATSDYYAALRADFLCHGHVLSRTETKNLFYNFVVGRALSAVETHVITRWFHLHPWTRGEPIWLTRARKRISKRARRYADDAPISAASRPLTNSENLTNFSLVNVSSRPLIDNDEPAMMNVDGATAAVPRHPIGSLVGGASHDHR